MRCLWNRAALALLLATCLGNATGSAQPPDTSYAIPLRSRTFTPQPGTEPEVLRRLRAEDRPHHHVIVQLYGEPSPSEHKLLQESGIRLQGKLGGNAYSASVARGTDLSAEGLRKLIRWAGPYQPGDKLSPALARKRYYDWAVEKRTNKVRLLVQFFPDVNADLVRKDLAGLGVTNNGRYGADNSWQVEADPKAIEQLAQLDAVRFLQQGPVPFLPLNNGGRRVTNTDEAHQVDLTNPQPIYAKVSGLGIRIGICDSGVDENYNDFMEVSFAGTPGASRVYNPRAGSGSHGTHVASIAAGNGLNSASNGLPAFLRMGHAPRAGVGDYPSFGGNAQSFSNAIVNDKTDVTNHSYVQSFTIYDATAASLDKIVRGDGRDDSGKPIPARPQVWAAGNNGSSAQYGDEEGFYAVFTSAKNTISVGSLDTLDARLSDFSSLGPTFDGRIKPDVVAPGSKDSIASSSGGIEAASSGTQGYTGKSGTSMAAPVVSGVIALMMEQYAKTYGVHPNLRPSTYKAILIHSARDRLKTRPYPDREFNNPDTAAALVYHAGPDYVTGYGLVDAEGARDLVARSRQWKEATLAATGAQHTWCLEVRPGETELKVVIAWDDEPGDTMSAETAAKLVNDLDLELINPKGNTYLPWVLDPLPLTASPGSGAPDPIKTSDLRPAYRGRDRRNNVEMVSVCHPMPGTWKVRVKAFSLPLGNAQPYSLVSSSPIRIWCPGPGLFPAICKRFPWVCELRPDLPFEIIDREWVVHPEVPVPIDEICKYMINCPGCTGPGWQYCPGWRLGIRQLPKDAVVLVFNQKGEVVAEDGSGGEARTLRVERVLPGDQHFLLIADPKGFPYKQKLRLGLELGPLGERREGPHGERLNTGANPTETNGRQRIKLPNREFAPQPGVEPALLEKLRSSREPVYGIVLLSRKPDPADRAALTQAGVTLHSFLGGTAYHAAFSGNTRLENVRDLLEWAGPLKVQDKLEPQLWQGQPEKWAVTEGGELRVLVSFQPHVRAEEARKVLEGLAKGFRSHGPSGAWAIEIALDRLPKLASEEAVRWIEQGPLPFRPLDGESKP